MNNVSNCWNHNHGACRHKKDILIASIVYELRYVQKQSFLTSLMKAANSLVKVDAKRSPSSK